MALLRASSEFRGMENLLQAARSAEQEPSLTFPAKLRSLIAEIQTEIDNIPQKGGMIMLVSSDPAYAIHLTVGLQNSKSREARKTYHP